MNANNTNTEDSTCTFYERQLLEIRGVYWKMLFDVERMKVFLDNMLKMSEKLQEQAEYVQSLIIQTKNDREFRDYLITYGRHMRGSDVDSGYVGDTENINDDDDDVFFNSNSEIKPSI
jgi:hypothetical protein